MEEVRLSGLFVYPVKGCRGIALDAAEVGERGLLHDREWMVVGADGTFLSQRRYPRLALVEAVLTGDRLVLQAPGMAALRLPLDERGAPRPVTIWRDTVTAESAGGEAAAWFAAFLSFACDLVRMPATTERCVDPFRARPGDLLAFADAFPFLLVSEASLDGLNRRLADALPMDRFRPNLVVAGCAEHAEDHWRTLRTGALTFHVAAPCARCVVTTTDQSTAVQAAEPLRTLAGYRLRDGEIHFGQNLVHDGRGVLRLGDRCTAEA